jgi:uncharacterized LabA/DUF88 family protein
MLFVDGENLAIRYGCLLALKGSKPWEHIRYERNVYVWSPALNDLCVQGNVIRRHYYTSVQGDEPRLDELVDQLKDAGIDNPYVFKKTQKRSKRVDIQLSTDMLLHAARKNYEVAILIAGDQDYVPLVEAVKSEGRRVYVWAVSKGLSPALRRAADHFNPLDELLLAQEARIWA